MLSLSLLFGALILAAALLVRRRRRTPAWWSGWVAVLAAAALALAVMPPLFLLRKTVAVLLMPTSLVWFGLLAAGYACRDRRPALWGIATVTLLYTLAGNTGCAYLVGRSLESPYWEIRPLADEEAYEAVFVLGGGVKSDHHGDPQLTLRGDRARLPALLHLAGRADTLVASGSLPDGRDLAGPTRELWRSLGVPHQAIEVLPGPMNTAQEIDAYAALIRERGWRRIGLVTSATHMRRAQLLCSRRGIEMAPLPTDFRTDPATRWMETGFWWLPPSGSALDDLEIVLWEYFGLAAVYFMGY